MRYEDVRDPLPPGGIVDCIQGLLFLFTVHLSQLSHFNIGSRMSADNGPKAPKLGDSYALFKKEVKLWESTTKIEENRRAGTIVLSLPEKAKEQALEIDLKELQNGRKVTVNNVEQTLTGIDCLLEALCDIRGKMGRIFPLKLSRQNLNSNFNFTENLIQNIQN